MHLKAAHVDLVVAEARARDTGRVAVIATDVAGHIVYWNEQAAELYGWEPHDAIGRNVLDVMPTYSSAEQSAVIMEQLRRGESWSGDIIVRNRAGEPILAHVTDVPVHYRSTVVGIVGISRGKRRGN